MPRYLEATRAKLSALSVLVFGGPRSIGALARAEQVRLPTMSRLVTMYGQLERYAEARALGEQLVAVRHAGRVVRNEDVCEGRCRVSNVSLLLEAVQEATDEAVYLRRIVVIEPLAVLVGQHVEFQARSSPKILSSCPRDSTFERYIRAPRRGS